MNIDMRILLNNLKLLRVTLITSVAYLFKLFTKIRLDYYWYVSYIFVFVVMIYIILVTKSLYRKIRFWRNKV